MGIRGKSLSSITQGEDVVNSLFQENQKLSTDTGGEQ